MAHESATILDCERLYVDEWLDLEEIAELKKVAKSTLYRWFQEGGWVKKREGIKGDLDKLREIASSIIKQELTEVELDPKHVIDAQRIHAIRSLIETINRLSKVREKLVYAEDAELLLKTMNEIPRLKVVLDDPQIMADLGEKLKEKLKR